MTAWRSLGSLAVAVVVAQLSWAQTYPLTETPQAGDHFRYHLQMTLSGEMRINRNDKPDTMKMDASATHEFPERILSVGSKGMPEKVARSYETARAVITVGKDKSERTLRPERNLFAAQRHEGQFQVYCPAGPLTREELELTGDHFDTLSLTGLLPGREVKVGDTWKVSNDTAQALCSFEGMTGQELVCKLEEVKDTIARVSVTGTATGIDLGAMVKLKIDASYQFDLNLHRLVAVSWKQKDDRDQGPASPASTVETTTVLQRKPIEQPETLTDPSIVSIPDKFDVPPTMLLLYYKDPKSRFDITYNRGWQIVGQTDQHLFMRLMQRGDFIAQVTLTPWTKAKPGEHETGKDFEKEMGETPGWEQEKVVQTGEVPTEPGRWMYRISALGKMDGLDVMQNFYLVAGPGGEQLVAAFTMTPKQAEKLKEQDLTFAGSIDFPAAPKQDEKPKQ